MCVCVCERERERERVDFGPVVVELTAEVDEQFAVDVVVDGRRRHVHAGVVQRQFEVAA